MLFSYHQFHIYTWRCTPLFFFNFSGRDTESQIWLKSKNPFFSTKLEESKWILTNISVYHTKFYGENPWILAKFHWENPNGFSHLTLNFWPWRGIIMNHQIKNKGDDWFLATVWSTELGFKKILEECDFFFQFINVLPFAICHTSYLWSMSG